MTTSLNRRLLLQAGLFAGTLPWARPGMACEYFSPTLRITHPWARATPMSATFALVGMRFDDVSEDDQLLDVQTPVAGAVVFAPALHMRPSAHADDTLPLPLNIPAGRDTVLDGAVPGSTGPHLRLLRLTQDLEVARSYPMRLVFSRGGTVKVLLNIDYARFA